MNLRKIPFGVLAGFVFWGTAMLGMVSCDDSKLNTVADPHFDEYGHLVRDTASSDTFFRVEQPTAVRFYVEVSGSMNGFFRANQATDFKADLWTVLTYYKPIVSDVTILTNDGNQGASMSLADFQRSMNSGAFVSSAETKVPTMLGSILSCLHPEEGEVAVLVSDMKYSPERDPARAALNSQYSSDVSSQFAAHPVAASLLAATSNYLGRDGSSLEDESPYYYLVLGAPETAGYMRTGISTLLTDRGHFVDGFEMGYDYKDVPYSFGKSKQALQLTGEPTFYGWDASYDDTCTVNLQLDLSQFRWLTADSAVVRRALDVKALYGTQVEVGKIEVDCTNKQDRQIERKAQANVEIKLTGMPAKSDVIEWTFNHPDELVGGIERFFGAQGEGELGKTFSIEDFIQGMTYGGHVNTWNKKPNYILISKED